jgi:DMSO/TMAO reductase YedYZ molybdopterin-dependent catalytic subunit
MKRLIQLSLLLGLLVDGVSIAYSQVEIKEYKGEKLSPYDRQYDNSIKGPQKVDEKTFRLRVTGIVQQPVEMNYKEILALPSVTRAITLNCIEGWSEHLLFKGFRMVDLLKKAKPKKETQTVIFYAIDGYSSSLPYKFVVDNDIMIAYDINGLKLDAERGFPLQVVAESKFGYKWVKWLERIELSDKPYLGYWERLGYDNDASILK